MQRSQHQYVSTFHYALHNPVASFSYTLFDVGRVGTFDNAATCYLLDAPAGHSCFAWAVFHLLSDVLSNRCRQSCAMYALVCRSLLYLWFADTGETLPSRKKSKKQKKKQRQQQAQMAAAGQESSDDDLSGEGSAQPSTAPHEADAGHADGHTNQESADESLEHMMQAANIYQAAASRDADQVSVQVLCICMTVNGL